MLNSIKLLVKSEDIIAAVKRMKKTERDAFLEDLLAATSPEYLKSIREARADYAACKVKSHEEVFGLDYQEDPAGSRGSQINDRGDCQFHQD